jgi:hypothetical protein
MRDSGEAVVVWLQDDGLASSVKSNTYEADNSGMPNIAPIANTVTGLIADEQVAVILDGSSAFDQDGTIANYAWSQLSGTVVALDTLDTATTGIASFDAPELTSSEVLLFQLAVTDDGAAVNTSDVSVTVNPVNLDPVADAGLDQSVDEQTGVSLSGSGSDSDGSITTYAWAQTGGAAVTLNDADTATATFDAPVVLVGDSPLELTFELTVTDNELASAVDSVTVTVNAINASPSANAGSDQVVAEQIGVSLSGSGSDTDGSIATYAWTQTGGVGVTLVNPDSADAGFTAPAVLATAGPQLLFFELTVTDNEGATATDTVMVTINAVNAIPTVDAGLDQSIDEQTGVSLNGSAADGDGSIATYAWAQTGGPGVTLTGAGLATAGFTAPIVLVGDGPQLLTFELTVTDNEGATATDSIDVTVNPVNAAPSADAGLDQTVAEQTSVSLIGSGADADDSVASYSWAQTGVDTVTLTSRVLQLGANWRRYRHSDQRR